jgi:hypothetical protein
MSISLAVAIEKVLMSILDRADYIYFLCLYFHHFMNKNADLHSYSLLNYNIKDYNFCNDGISFIIETTVIHDNKFNHL